MAKDQAFKEALISMLSEAGEYSDSYMFYGCMVAQCKRVMDPSLNAPAAVGFHHDHYVLYINPTEFEKFSLVERLAVLKHEMLHILNGHLERKDDRDMLGWNYATDCAINQQIEHSHLPKITQEIVDKYGKQAAASGKPLNVGEDICILPHNYPAPKGVEVPFNMNSEFYYELFEDSEENKKSESSDNEGPRIDSHTSWEESEGDPDLQKDVTKKMIETSISNTEKSRGNIPNAIAEFLKIHERHNEVDWRRVLRNIVGTKKVNARRTLMRRDRRFPNRMDIKGKTKDKIFTLLVISDVSGSVNDEALLALLTEVRNICEVTKTPVDLIQVDSIPSLPEKLKANTSVIKRKGHGGTNLHPALNTAKEHKVSYDAVVVTTDGYLSGYDVQQFAKLGKRVIWLIEHNGNIMDEMNSRLMKAFKLKEN